MITKMRLAVIALLLAVGLLAAFALRDGGLAPGAPVGGTPNAGYEQITVDELHAMLSAKDFHLINVHIPFEGEIEPTDQHIPYDELAKSADHLPVDKDAKVVLYCQTGRMSTIAARDMVALGYTNVLELRGGMVAWTQQGYPLLGAPGR